MKVHTETEFNNIKSNNIKICRQYSDYYIVVVKGESYDEICCYDYDFQLIWKQRDRDPESTGNIVNFIKINSWVKVFYSNDKVIRIRAESEDSSAYGIYLDYGIEVFDKRLLDMSINKNILIYNDVKITLENTINDIKLYDDNIFILANSKKSSCSNNWLTLYAYDFYGNCKWIIEDYSKKLGIKTSRIDYFGFIEGELYAETFDAYRLYINIETGKVDRYVSFAKFK